MTPPRIDAPRYTVVADPASRRWEYYHRELLQFWRSRRREPEINVVSWRDLIDRDGCLDGLPVGDAPSLLRIESPARNFGIKRALLQAGERDEGRAPSAWENPDGERGWLASPRLVHRGFRRVLNGLDKSVSQRPDLIPLANAADILELFDKNATSETLSHAGLPTPEWFRPGESVEELVGELWRRRWRSAYVKLAYGSSAAGIALFNVYEEKPSITTTVLERNGRFYSSRRLKTVEPGSPAFHDVLQFLLDEGATVQRALPKTRLGVQNFDVRVVVIRGSVAGCVFRVSSHPMTNLHLGGRRGDPAECRQVIPQRHWLDALDACVEAARLYRLPAVGVDVAFDRRTCQPAILELNAFGDFFPDWRNARGETVHAQEIAATAREYGLL